MSSLSQFDQDLESLRNLRSPTPPLQGAIEAGQNLHAVLVESAFDDAEAVGIWIDNVDDPHLAVVVHDGQIVYIGISDGMLLIPVDQLQDVLNAAIMNAFGSWRMQANGGPKTA